MSEQLPLLPPDPRAATRPTKGPDERMARFAACHMRAASCGGHHTVHPYSDGRAVWTLWHPCDACPVRAETSHRREQ